MNSNIIKKAFKLGKKLTKLTSEDSIERSIFFTLESESIIGKGSELVMNFYKMKKVNKDKLERFLDDNKNRNDLSGMHSHPFEVTFSVGDIQAVKFNWDENKINYQFVTTSKHLYLIYIPPNLKHQLKLSSKLLNQLANIDNNIWKKVDVKKFEKTDLGKGKTLMYPVGYNEQQKTQHNQMWNKEFKEFFKRWNYINLNQLEYKIFDYS